MTIKSLAFAALLAGGTLLGVSSTGTVHAAVLNPSAFTPSEKVAITTLQQAYNQLSSTTYTPTSLYQQQPNWTTPFRSGSLAPAYITTSLAWLNYYRQLAHLNPVASTTSLNSWSQLGATALAAAKASPYLPQHGLANATRPAGFPLTSWQSAQQATASSNLYFGYGSETAGTAITSLINDNTNLDGNDTGHRAWLLSAFLSKIGVGAAYGTNGTKYVDLAVVNAADGLRKPSASLVTYPASGLFPLEELAGSFPWSLYIANTAIAAQHNVTVTIRDTTDQRVLAHEAATVYNYAQYGYYKSIVTFSPPENLILATGHTLQVQYSGLDTRSFTHGTYSYTFKTFNESQATLTNWTSATTPLQTTGQVHLTTASLTPVTTPGGTTLASGAPLTDGTTLTLTASAYAQGQLWYQIGPQQWINAQYVELAAPTTQQGIIKVLDSQGSVNLKTSPYADQQNSGQLVKNGSRWRYSQAVSVGGQTWYKLGANRWIADGQSVDDSPLYRAQAGIITASKQTRLYLNPETQAPSPQQVAKGSRWRYNRVAIINGQTWYQLGTNRWISQANCL